MLYWWKSFQIFITKKISYYLRFVCVYFLILSIFFFKILSAVMEYLEVP
jgi:hypothetical protein